MIYRLSLTTYIYWIYWLLSFRFLVPCTAFFSGMIINEWKKGEIVPLRVSNLKSISTQVPINYYSLPYCMPEVVVSDEVSIGDIILGNSAQNSPYKIRVLENVKCRLLCRYDEVSEDKRNLIKSAIDDSYRVQWIIDHLFNLTPLQIRADTTSYVVGFPVGYVKDNMHYLNNHITIILLYNEVITSEKIVYRIVGFQTLPFSVRHELINTTEILCDESLGQLNVEDLRDHLHNNDAINNYNGYENIDTTNKSDTMNYKEINKRPLTFSYDVYWQKSTINFSQRWDAYFLSTDDPPMIHWFPIINSLVIALLLFAVVAMVLIRILYRDIARYNESASIIDEEDIDETGWKLVHADVFRKPVHSTLLVAFVGSGMQILGMVLITLIFSVIGFFPPEDGGNLLRFVIFLWTTMGTIAGYTSAKLYKIFKSNNWKVTTMRTALIFGGVVFIVFFILEFILWTQNSAAVISFSSLLMILLLWFGISVPLVYLGAFIAFRQKSISIPVRVNKIPRQIPHQSWFLHPIFCCILGGSLPFGAMFTELFFFLTSIWQHRLYYLFGFLLLILVIVCITCAETSINLVYLHLVCEDYNWWWRSFFVPASSGIYVFLYSIYYSAYKLKLTRLTALLIFFCYSFIFSYAFFILTGSVGFVATFFFLRKIYGSIKVD